MKSAIVPSVENGDVPGFGTAVPFTEGLLRSITNLHAEQQLWLVKSLATVLGKAQAKIAEIMRWARTSVANYLALKNICPVAWQIVVVTTKASAVTDGNTEVVTPNATTVTFTEHMLRSITCLTAEQQLWLVKSLVSGKMDKAQFKAIAENAKARNGWRTEAARG